MNGSVAGHPHLLLHRFGADRGNHTGLGILQRARKRTRKRTRKRARKRAACLAIGNDLQDAEALGHRDGRGTGLAHGRAESDGAVALPLPLAEGLAVAQVGGAEASGVVAVFFVFVFLFVVGVGVVVGVVVVVVVGVGTSQGAPGFSGHQVVAAVVVVQKVPGGYAALVSVLDRSEYTGGKGAGDNGESGGQSETGHRDDRNNGVGSLIRLWDR
mmetsp:Transcript_18679/g.52220  ORF Transcript_18679/g.52220 Transcript_18679/m.52220 type:complete len:214 (+) Transcript_18679:436-1077(+)